MHCLSDWLYACANAHIYVYVYIISEEPTALSHKGYTILSVKVQWMMCICC